MSAAAPYYEVEGAIQAQLVDYEPLRLADVVVEEPETPLYWRERPSVFIYLIDRAAPEDRQSISAGQRTRFLVQYSVWLYVFGLENLPALARQRDKLLGLVELALSVDRTFGRADVTTSWLAGGRFNNAATEGENFEGLMSGAEAQVVVDLSAIYTS